MPGLNRVAPDGAEQIGSDQERSGESGSAAAGIASGQGWIRSGIVLWLDLPHVVCDPDAAHRSPAAQLGALPAPGLA